MFEIVHRYTLAVLYRSETATTQREAVLEAATRSADLGGANLRSANLGEIKADLFAVLAKSPYEVLGLLSALRDGRVDGSTYHGKCACLVGTLANLRKCDYDAIPDLRPDSSRPSEVWFMGIRSGDTPSNSQVSKLTEGWVVEWLRAEGDDAVRVTLDADDTLAKELARIAVIRSERLTRHETAALSSMTEQLAAVQ